MENTEKKYWKGLEELHQTPEFLATQGREFPEEIKIEDLLESGTVEKTVTARRDFLKVMGFGLGAVTLAACNTAPVRKSIPYLVKPEEVIPGVPNYYASTLPNGHGVLVKTREGRPIKIEGNPNCPITKGGVDAVGHASILALYDDTKLKTPLKGKSPASWESVDNFVKDELAAVRGEGKTTVILSSTINSPSTLAIINDFIVANPGARHIMYDAVSSSAIIQANKNSFDKAVLPTYKFDVADVIVGFSADFLGTWISPVEHTKQYLTKRNAIYLRENKSMSRHIHFETNLSITGAKADSRFPVSPSDENLAILGLYNALATKAGAPVFAAQNVELPNNGIQKTADELWAARGRSLVVSGSNDVSVQVVINAINSLLENYGTTIDLDNPTLTKNGNDAEVTELIASMERGEVGAIFLYGVNPAYEFPNTTAFTNALQKVRLKVSFADRADETGLLCDVVAPDHHFLEAWGDSQPRSDVFYIAQPTIAPIYNTRAAQQSLLNWAEQSVNYADYIKNYWQTNIFPKAGVLLFREGWENLLRTGFIKMNSVPAQNYRFTKDLAAVAQSVINQSSTLNGKTQLKIYEKVGLRDGKHANNPWLQELPDPVSKVTWDNYASISPKFANELGIKERDMAEITVGDISMVLPVLIQPGQANNTVAMAVGYGRVAGGKVANEVGKNAYPFVQIANGSFQYVNTVSIAKTRGKYELAQTQTHQSIEGRDIIRETVLSEYQKDAGAGSRGKLHGMKFYDLWDKFEKKGHHWAMAIDLNACTGCGACVVSCNAENNVAIVGRDEVRRRREMHWIRIDRYYSEDIENPDNVEVVYQPMLCQHCDHAPCETVCPVLATVHSSEGLNQMTYNRCIGTRYCANNCPYKVRRFNWFNYIDNDKFDYLLNSDMGKLVLNPDVTVRARGVMEKCSWCVQRIQSSKLKAKMDRVELKDGDVETACSSSCPANAIIFGDMNDKDSRVAKMLENERTYYVLEELNVQSGIGYQTLVRNKETSFRAQAPFEKVS